MLHGDEAGWNSRLAGGWKHLRTIADATEVLYADGLKPNRMRYWAALRRYARQGRRILLYDVWHPTLVFLARITRPLRRRNATVGRDTPALPR